MEQPMSSETTQESFRARTLELANRAIESVAAADHDAARAAWLVALDYAERHLSDDPIVSWIRSGLGAALLKTGDYRGALEMAASALAFCSSVRAPLASLTMAESFLRLGDVTRAREYAEQACNLHGKGVLKSFSPTDREALGLDAPP
jgi:tetratricopeptide (TPR) repeat protein